MNRSKLVRLVVAAALAGIAGALFAQQALEIIPLHHRSVDQVLPVLQPILEPGATLSGSRGQLFLRASPANAAEIKRALEAIDRPSKRLQISVRFEDALERERRAVGASGTISNRGSRVEITAAESRRSAIERVDQRLQVLEGGRAFIFTGQSRPLYFPGGALLQEAGTGFGVVPRMAGDQVLLEISPERETQRAATEITARLGEWVEVAAIGASATRYDRGIASASGRQASELHSVWVKVEELQ